MSRASVTGELRLTGTGLLATLLGVAAAARPDLALVLLFSLVVIAAAALPTQWLVILSLPLLAWPLLWVAQGQDTRLGVVALAGLVAVRVLLSRDDRNLVTSPTGWRIVVLAAVALASITWSADPLESAGAGLALLAIGVLLTGLPPAGVTEAKRILVIVGSAFLLLNVAVALTPIGMLAGRSRGLFANPNSLAVVIVLLLPLLMAHPRYRLVGVLSLGLLVTTGSRAGVLAACAELLVALVIMTGVRSSGRRVIATALLVGLAFVALRVLASGAADQSSLGSASYVLRSGDSRTAIWLQALDDWQVRPVLGYGAGANPRDTANSYLKLLTDLGLIGVVAALPLLILQAKRFWYGRPQQAALVAGAVVSACFESWLFAGGSLFFLLYWMQMGGRDDPADR